MLVTLSNQHAHKTATSWSSLYQICLQTQCHINGQPVTHKVCRGPTNGLSVQTKLQRGLTNGHIVLHKVQIGPTMVIVYRTKSKGFYQWFQTQSIESILMAIM